MKVSFSSFKEIPGCYFENKPKSLSRGWAFSRRSQDIWDSVLRTIGVEVEATARRHSCWTGGVLCTGWLLPLYLFLPDLSSKEWSTHRMPEVHEE